MKKTILSIVILLFMFSLNAQTKTFDPKPKGMEFVPAGSVQMKMTRASEPNMTNVSVEAFWMSNEITNSEYKEYVDYIKQNPNGKICWVDFENAAKDKAKGTPNTKEEYIICVKNSEIIGDIIDLTKLPYNDYFSNKKFDDYPVVGISQKHAKYYCLWKTQMENDKLKKEGMPAIHAYRLPLEVEWEYVAQQSADKQNPNKDSKVIQKANEGNPNKLGLFHLEDNVSEWVVPMPKVKGFIIRGGSWKTNSNINDRQVLDPDCKEGYIGFRIVRSIVTTVPQGQPNTRYGWYG
ncbi:MAG: SUMF1/EgtB/PvdO family nonheme iron enzyme [Bacteroidia bacterium]|nr:SUMF1/EgtB/PvdO family nonheme iron enzyme [Bacteroidia bacterium]